MPATDGDSIVLDCPVCSRVIWRNATCRHGLIPEPGNGPDPHDNPPSETAYKKKRGGLDTGTGPDGDKRYYK